MGFVCLCKGSEVCCGLKRCQWCQRCWHSTRPEWLSAADAAQVRRDGVWKTMSARQVVPGDVGGCVASSAPCLSYVCVSVSRLFREVLGLYPLLLRADPLTVAVTMEAGAEGDVIPCDCLVLHGAAVVNEATLTGKAVCVHTMCDYIPAAAQARACRK